jgi:hypothetical protein
MAAAAPAARRTSPVVDLVAEAAAVAPGASALRGAGREHTFSSLLAATVRMVAP